MSKTIFFSWQSDTPNRCGRSFLKDVLDDVCSELAADTTLDEANRDVVPDSDTQGVAGQPPIAETIFKKIDAATVFVADMTFTGKRLDDRPTPNPNVLIEYGWAIKSLTNERVICLMNTAYGAPTAETLPFDLAHLRRPMQYHLPEDSSAEIKTSEKRKLVRTLKEAIRLCLTTIPAPEPTVLPSFPAQIENDGPARFRRSGEPIGLLEDYPEDGSVLVFLNPGPAMWLRIFPEAKPQKEWPTTVLKKLALTSDGMLFPLYRRPGGYSFLRASDGVGWSRAQTREPSVDRIHTRGLGFIFKTGEIWSIETELLNFDKNVLFQKDIENSFLEGLSQYSLFLQKLGIDFPFKWKAGLIGIKGRRLLYTPPSGYVLAGQGPICATDHIEVEGQLKIGDPVSIALLPFFKEIFEACGIERPDYSSQ